MESEDSTPSASTSFAHGKTTPEDRICISPTVNAEEATAAFLNSEFAVEHANYFIEMLSGSTRVDYPNRTAVESEMKSYLELIYAGDMTAAEGLAEFQEVADEIMGK